MFSVTGCGVLTAIYANIAGKIDATSGYIGGWEIRSDALCYVEDGDGAGFWSENIGTTSLVISVWDNNTYM